MGITSSGYFHGATADELHIIISSKSLRPNQDGKIFLARFEWQSCLAHGADRKRKAAFVAKLIVSAPSESMTYVETPGVRDTVIIQSDQPIPATVIELYVRRLQVPGERADLLHLRGLESIQSYLTTAQ